MAQGAVRRRAAITLMGAAFARMATAQVADGAALVVAGPENSDAARWAGRLGPDLAEALDEPALSLRFWGGQDGVTGLNRFAAWAAPDGSTALVFPGGAALKGLAGDQRLHADAFRLIPVLAVRGPALVLARRTGSVPVRVACPGDPRTALAALLGLDLLGVAAVPAPCAGDEVAAVAANIADAAFLHGEHVAARAAVLREAGLAPLFALPAPDGGRDPDFPNVPTLRERLPRAPRLVALARAWEAVATASATHLVLALPALTHAGAVARWRQAARAAAPATAGLVVASAAEAAVALAGMRADAEAQLSLRQWLAHG